VQNYSEIVAGWETLYLLVGTAAATLMGLLFVAISINVEKFQQAMRMDLRNFGALTFNSFFYVLLVAILFLTPGLGWRGTGVVLLLLGVVDLTNALLQLRRAKGAGNADRREEVESRFTFPILCLVALVISAVLILFRVSASLYVVSLAAVLLLGAASVNAWLLLVRADERLDEVVEQGTAREKS
jgi:hypothetical protein